MSSGPKKCGKCQKTVYPVEEIICLDKSWHKGCLKCTVCNTTLNIKNVKGYEKMPYCNVHYPQLKSTAVADNPELQRLRHLTDVQSNAKYHKDFNENKGKFTVIADDPATQRAKEQQKNVSQAEYTSKRKESLSNVVDSDSHSTTNPTTNDQTASPASASASGVGQLADYDPLNGKGGSLSRGYEPASNEDEFQLSKSGLFQTNLKPESEQRKSVQDEQPVENPPSDTQSSKLKVRALYEYVAAEADEISFQEGDTLIDIEQIDDGWMMGTNPKTGAKGLLPSNYVEILN